MFGELREGKMCRIELDQGVDACWIGGRKPFVEEEDDKEEVKKLQEEFEEEEKKEEEEEKKCWDDWSKNDW